MCFVLFFVVFFFSSRRRHTRCLSDWSSDVCSSDLVSLTFGNMQRWRFLVIRDPKVKETVGALYKRAWDEQVAPRYRSGRSEERRVGKECRTRWWPDH